MKQNRFKFTFFLNLILALVVMNTATAQEKKVAPTSAELYKEIEKMDEIMFEAFNKKDFEKFKSLFTEDLEWFQDNGGLLSYETVFNNFSNMFKNENKLRRKLVKGTLEVHPVKDYGAIEIGVHEFRHMENGKEEIGTFKFLMIWKKKDNQWKIARVISYDH
ncbi:nuclear transport factor 2 family protein [Flavobacterium psychrolimnae]|uniref:Nuclear transport factor 2 family protein n=1 Tax=Flavobacterium psychrolimnae TaxID=249351 RepID=A0A366B282_9FLAO|nr:nuclear transport factor 2 family protein [Flavobacterium psychrolimnae]RBN50277.1 nuclear transport factor 2 family protein [Flavobacterium psychrolimnae]